jgi:hypothetical protein
MARRVSNSDDPVLVPDFMVTTNGVDLETKDETEVLQVVLGNWVYAIGLLLHAAAPRRGRRRAPIGSMVRSSARGKAQIKLG